VYPPVEIMLPGQGARVLEMPQRAPRARARLSIGLRLVARRVRAHPSREIAHLLARCPIARPRLDHPARGREAMGSARLGLAASHTTAQMETPDGGHLARHPGAGGLRMVARAGAPMIAARRRVGR